MSVLTIAQRVARAAGFTAPSSLVGSTDETAIQLLELIKEETTNLSDGVIAGRDNSIDYNWQVLVKRGTFNFASGAEAYDVPVDFKDYIPNTMWNYTAKRPIIVPINAEEFEVQKNYLTTTGIDKMIYFYADQMHVVPNPSATATDTINYEYTTTYIYQSSGGTGQTDILADTDVTTISENIVLLGVKFRFLQAKGIIPTSSYMNSLEYQNYVSAVQRAMYKDGMGQKRPISFNRRGRAFWLAAYTQDSDYPAS